MEYEKELPKKEFKKKFKKRVGNEFASEFQKEVRAELAKEDKVELEMKMEVSHAPMNVENWASGLARAMKSFVLLFGWAFTLAVASVFASTFALAKSVFSSTNLFRHLGPDSKSQERFEFEKPEWKQHGGFGPWNQ